MQFLRSKGEMPATCFEYDEHWPDFDPFILGRQSCRRCWCRGHWWSSLHWGWTEALAEISLVRGLRKLPLPIREFGYSRSSLFSDGANHWRGAEALCPVLHVQHSDLFLTGPPTMAANNCLQMVARTYVENQTDKPFLSFSSIRRMLLKGNGAKL